MTPSPPSAPVRWSWPPWIHSSRAARARGRSSGCASSSPPCPSSCTRRSPPPPRRSYSHLAIRASTPWCSPGSTTIPRGRSGAVCPPAAAGSGVHDRRRRPTPRLRPDQDAAAARPLLSRAHRRRDAAHPRAPRGPRAHRSGIRPAAPGARLGVMSGTPHPPSSASRSSTILIVEDDAALRRVLERALVRQGYRVLAAASAETVYELLASEPADAVLLDVQLPTMSGLALYLALIHRHPALAGRIAIMSGDAEADNVRAWLQNNPCTVLNKPFDLRQIIEWAKELLDASDRRTGNG